MVQMRDHNLCFDAEIWKIIHKLLYPFLSGALIWNKCFLHGIGVESLDFMKYVGCFIRINC